MSLTREDMLRELELLPVWRLNAPLEAKQQAALSDAPIAPPIEVVTEPKVEPQIEAMIEAEALVEVERDVPQELESQVPALPDIANMDWAELNNYVTGSGDQNADWLFVGDVAMDGDAATLLDKMLIAIQLQRGQNVYLTQLFEPEYFKRQIALIQPKLIFVFGERAAQTLLNSQEPLDALRGQVHQYENVALIVSYAPSHLLTNTQDKAKAWADLCLARDTVQGIK